MCWPAPHSARWRSAVRPLRPTCPSRPPPTLRPAFDWSGFYIGGHVGYGGGSFGPDTNPLPLQGVFFPHSITGLIGGYQAGYNFQLPNNLVLGAEVDVSFLSTLDRPRLVPAPFNTSFDYMATVRGRVGYAFGTLLPYLTGGVAWARTRVDVNDADGSVLSERGHAPLGWTAGAGVEYAADAKWSAKLEYGYIDLGARTYGLADVPLPDVAVDPKIHTVKVGLNYKIWDGPGSATSGDYAIKPPTPPVVQGLERPCPDDLHIAGLSELPLAVSRHEQPAGRRTRARDLDGRSLSRMAVVGRRRALFWSGACAGLWNRRHIRLGRFFKRRSAKRRRRVSEIPRTALFLPADVRAGGRTGRSGRCSQSIAGQTRHRPGHCHGRAICGRRFLRRQFLRKRPAS